MKNSTLILLFVSILAVFSLNGCQSKVDENKVNVENPTSTEHAVPFSKGPSNAPQVKGPTTPPPGSENAAPQAVTEKENIRLTLPLKNS